VLESQTRGIQPPVPQQTVITSPVVVRVVEAPPADALQWWGLIIIPLALTIATGGLVYHASRANRDAKERAEAAEREASARARLAEEKADEKARRAEQLAYQRIVDQDKLMAKRQKIRDGFTALQGIAERVQMISYLCGVIFEVKKVHMLHTQGASIRLEKMQENSLHFKRVEQNSGIAIEKIKVVASFAQGGESMSALLSTFSAASNDFCRSVEGFIINTTTSLPFLKEVQRLMTVIDSESGKLCNELVRSDTELAIQPENRTANG
jgi:hypothetical protein